MKLLCACAVGALAASAANAQSLYSTGWEPAPASPAWATGNVVPQNSWAGFNTLSGHQVRGNGFSVGGTPVTAAAGTQFHYSNSSTTGAGRYAWPDITAAWNARTAGNDVALVSTDMFLPIGSTNPGRHGIEGYGTDAVNGAGALGLAGFFVNPATAGLHLDDAATGAASPVLATVPRGVWFNVSMQYNSVTGFADLYLNGTWVGGLNAAPAPLGINDFDLFNIDSFDLITVTPNSQMATDNYGVSAVPTPGAAAALGLGLLAGARRRR